MESTAQAMETSSGENWRKDTGDRLRRLHSLLFGAELALERGDATTSRLLSLRLLGFLDSQKVDGSDASFVNPIRTEAATRLAKAGSLLASDSDRQAFEQAKQEDGCVFAKKGNIDTEKIKKSKYFQALLQNSKGNTAKYSVPNVSTSTNPSHYEDLTFRNHKHYNTNKIEPLERDHDKLSSKASSSQMTQTKLTYIYGNKPLKPNSISHKPLIANVPNSTFAEHMDIDTAETRIGQTGQMGHKNNQHGPMTPVSVVEVEDEERVDRPNGLAGFKPKRRQAGFTSPICERTKSPSSNDEAEGPSGGFVTAKAKLVMDTRQKYGPMGPPPISPSNSNYAYKPTNGGYNRRGPRGNFVPPIRNNSGNNAYGPRQPAKGNNDGLEDSTRKCMEMLCGPDGEIPDKLKNIEPRLIEHISNEIMEKDPNVRWSDIAGLEHAKKCVMEMVIYPLIRPDIFKGCRSPGRGLLLFGPPGTGKTMIGKAIAGEAKATFFYISSSSLTSKWIGEGEKLVRALFGVASCRQPAVIFVDEIDSLLSQRKSEGEHESSRRLKTQFLIEMEGFDNGNEQILLIGATNRPQELDEAARRRLSRRLYIPLPSSEARAIIIRTLLEKDGLMKLSQEDISAICKLTEGYSGSDMKNVVKDAAMGPFREALSQGIGITHLKKEEFRHVNLKDFEDSIQEIRPSVALSELGSYEEWNKQYGSSKS